MTLRELVREGEAALLMAGVPDAGRDARMLLQETFQIPAADYVLHAGDRPEEAFSLPAEELALRLDTYRERIRQRALRIPLQQILGSAVFMGLEFKVSEHTLCPRQDTEVLVEEVLQDWKGKTPRVLDLCTGTGCIGVSLGLLGGLEEVTLTDLSEEALKVASFNAQVLGKDGSCTFHLYQGDLFEALPFGERFDVIVSNPPYISDPVIETLEPEVKTYEPRMALSGGKDGLDVYRRLIAAAPKYAPELYLEIGYDQTAAVRQLMEDAGYGDVKVIRDYGGRDRVVRGSIKQRK